MAKSDRVFAGFGFAAIAAAILMPLVERPESDGRSMPGSCTIFCVSHGGSVFMGNNTVVEEAIRMARSYDWGRPYGGKFAGQYLLADATGDAAVIGIEADGGPAVTRKRGGNRYIVSTNFRGRLEDQDALLERLRPEERRRVRVLHA